MSHPLLRALLLAALPCSAQAHHIWIEQSSEHAVLRFGEFAENLMEVSPGALDRLPPPTALRLGPTQEKTLTVSRAHDAFVLSETARAGESLVVEIADYPVREAKEGAKLRSKPVQTARYVTGPGALTPRNGLDIVPAGAPGRFRLYYQGKPLAKSKLSVAAPNGWGRELTSSEDGSFEFQPLWAGTYAIEAGHKDASPGSWQGQAYDELSYKTTLTFTLDAGPATPRPPLAKPH